MVARDCQDDEAPPANRLLPNAKLPKLPAPTDRAAFTGRPQSNLRELLRIVGEESSLNEAIERSRAWIPSSPPLTLQEAVNRLVGDEDRTLAGLARLHAAARANINVAPDHVAVDPRRSVRW